jgi:DNA gyrase inhibitor GyrI
MMLLADGWLGSDSRFIGIYHDDPPVAASEKIRYDACMTVDEAFQAQGLTLRGPRHEIYLA